MARIVTLTLNPTIDASCEADKVRPTQKTRTFDDRFQPGGGGINVARVLKRFGEDVHAIFLGGGVTGLVLNQLLDRAGVSHSRIAIADDTRMTLTVYERVSGQEYRFVPEGPEVSRGEMEQCLEALSGIECDYFIASGSLPPCVPDDFYAQAARIIAASGARIVVDTSGPALKAGLDAGGIFLVKPSRGELEELVGRPLATHSEIASAASDIIAASKTEMVAVSLGLEGAILVDRDGARFVRAAAVETRSAVGAGDSFLAAMIHGLNSGLEARSAFRMGVAAGAAAALTPGSDLAHPNEIETLLARLGKDEPI